MIRRAGFALAVISATIYWADCGFKAKVTPPEDPAWNGFFQGCFQGPITNPAGLGDVILVLQARPDDKVMLDGCLRLSAAGQPPENGVISGMVQDGNRQQATVMVTPSSSPIYSLRVQRNPAGNMDATAVDLSNENGAPFTSATNLTKSCAMTCPIMSIRMPFLPEGGTP